MDLKLAVFLLLGLSSASLALDLVDQSPEAVVVAEGAETVLHCEVKERPYLDTFIHAFFLRPISNPSTVNGTFRREARARLPPTRAPCNATIPGTHSRKRLFLKTCNVARV